MDFWKGSTSNLPSIWLNELGSSWFAYIDANAALFIITFFAAVLQLFNNSGRGSTTRLRWSLRTFALISIVCGSFCNILWLLDPTGGSLGGIGSSFVDGPSASFFSATVRTLLGASATAFYSLAIAILILIWRQILNAAKGSSVTTSTSSSSGADISNSLSYNVFILVTLVLILTVLISGLAAGGVIDEIIGASIVRAFIGVLTLCFCSFGVAFGAQLHSLLLRSSSTKRRIDRVNLAKNSSSSSSSSSLPQQEASTPSLIPTSVVVASDNRNIINNNNNNIVAPTISSTTSHKDWEESRRGINDLYSSARARVSVTVCRVIVIPLTLCAISMLFWSLSFAIAMQTRFIGSQLYLIHLSSTQLASLVAAWVVLTSLWIRRRSNRDDGFDEERKISAALKAKLIDIWDEPSLFLALSVNQPSSSSSSTTTLSSSSHSKNSSGSNGPSNSTPSLPSSSSSLPLPEGSTLTVSSMSSSSSSNSTQNNTSSQSLVKMNNTENSSSSSTVNDVNGSSVQSSDSLNSPLPLDSSSSFSAMQSHQRRAKIASTSRSPQVSLNLQLVPLDKVLASADLSARVIAAQRSELETIMAEHALLQAGIAAEYNSNNNSNTSSSLSSLSSPRADVGNSSLPQHSASLVQVVRNPLQYPRLSIESSSTSTAPAPQQQQQQQTFEPTGDSATDSAILEVLNDDNSYNDVAPLAHQHQQQGQGQQGPLVNNDNVVSSPNQSDLPVSFVQWLVNEWPKSNPNQQGANGGGGGGRGGGGNPSVSSAQRTLHTLPHVVDLQQQQQRVEEEQMISQSIPEFDASSFFDFTDEEGVDDTINELHADVENSPSDMYDSVLASYLSGAGGIAGNLAARATERIFDHHRYDVTSSSSSSSSLYSSSPGWMLGRLGWLAGVPSSSSSSSILPERNSQSANSGSGSGGGGGQRLTAETEMMTMTVNASIKAVSARQGGGGGGGGINDSQETSSNKKARNESNPFRVLAKAVRAHVASSSSSSSSSSSNHLNRTTTSATSATTSSSTLSSSLMAKRGVGQVPVRVNRSNSRGSHKDTTDNATSGGADVLSNNDALYGLNRNGSSDNTRHTSTSSVPIDTDKNNDNDEEYNNNDVDDDDDDDDDESAIARRRRQRQAQLVASLRARGMILPAALRNGDQEIDDYVFNGNETESGASEGSDISGWRDDDGSTEGGNDGGVGIGGVKSQRQQRALPIELGGGGGGGGSNRGGIGDDRRRSRSVA